MKKGTIIISVLLALILIVLVYISINLKSDNSDNKIKNITKKDLAGEWNRVKDGYTDWIRLTFTDSGTFQFDNSPSSQQSYKGHYSILKSDTNTVLLLTIENPAMNGYGEIQGYRYYAFKVQSCSKNKLNLIDLSSEMRQHNPVNMERK